MRKKFWAVLCTILILSTLLFTFTACKDKAPPAPTVDVVLKVSGSWSDCTAIEALATEFSKQYPSCAIEYENIQNYETNVQKRMTGENKIDLFFTNNIQASSPFVDYALDLSTRTDLDLSNTFNGLIENFKFREVGEVATKLYAIPVGAEMRGMYVNKTLLRSVGITETPTNQAELLSACQTLMAAGYTPFYGNPGAFAQHLLYPWVANLIANAADYDTVYEAISNRTEASLNYIMEPFEFMYDLVEADYYDYKSGQDDGYFNGNTDQDYARNFFNIKKNPQDVYEKVDDLGVMAFMPQAISISNVVAKTKEDYHSTIEYEFIPSPVGANGGYIYLSPAHGIAINKNSDNVDWTIKFMNFLFNPTNNLIFSENFGSIPNTKEALNYVRNTFNTPITRIAELGQVTFDYEFYDIITNSLMDISKANNPKYMIKISETEYQLKTFETFVSELKLGTSKREAYVISEA